MGWQFSVAIGTVLRHPSRGNGRAHVDELWPSIAGLSHLAACEDQGN